MTLLTLFVPLLMNMKITLPPCRRLQHSFSLS
ncbi:hypothetical protein AB1N83_012740 [Pleurotus pulmonarius]